MGRILNQIERHRKLPTWRRNFALSLSGAWLWAGQVVEAASRDRGRHPLVLPVDVTENAMPAPPLPLGAPRIYLHQRFFLKYFCERSISCFSQATTSTMRTDPGRGSRSGPRLRLRTRTRSRGHTRRTTIARASASCPSNSRPPRATSTFPASGNRVHARARCFRRLEERQETQKEWWCETSVYRLCRSLFQRKKKKKKHLDFQR